MRASSEEVAALSSNDAEGSRGTEVSTEDVRAYFARVRTLVETELERLVPAASVDPATV